MTRARPAPAKRKAARAWGFWTEHKLDILSAYLNAFTKASKHKAQGTTIYLDLFAGQAENASKLTGQPIDGSPVRALQASPPISTVVLFELPQRASKLEAQLKTRFPNRDIRVFAGDCNARVDSALRQLNDVTWAPTFAFIDQQGAEIRWSTLEKLARHKQRSKYKVEIWLLFAHAQLPRGLKRRSDIEDRFAQNVDAMLGTTDWRIAYNARIADELTAGQFRDELTNWMRWKLENSLGYKHTHAFELRNVGGTPVYSMVFATDNDAGNRIMSHLYGEAAKVHPKMREEALALRRGQDEEEAGTLALFPPMARESTLPAEKLYCPAPPHTPFGYREADF
jgi:three-Cys-motif partner protein